MEIEQLITNPATQHINLLYSTNTKKDVLHYQLYSQQGVLILSNKINVTKGENEQQIYIPPLSIGLYFLKCESRAGIFNTKLVIH
ncbi:MAG: T9SS type A sorting domain-containing protein [Salibacteraceae bacterium]